MTIQIGSRLGPYEILAHLGAGGMGEVYRARDTRVGRDVAVKVLPTAFASNEERLQRFEQEARAAAALNHPNLLTIHDVGTLDGVPYLVSELLDGETLREKLGTDRASDEGSHIPTRKAIEWAGAIATGLAAAHDKGVVHRDLKPENIFVTTDGRVKILDFGLAKLTSAFHEDAADSKTAQRNTSPGTVMGTVGYMSPEQVRGQNLDQRTDIFSLGAILYEMLSGMRAFRGESSADTMSAILREDPPDFAGSGAEVSAGLDRIIRRCLEKNPEERFHSAHDLAYALEAITGSSTRSAAVAMDEPRRSPWPVAAIIGGIVLAVTAFLAGRSSTKPAAPGDAPARTPAHLVHLTNLSGIESEVSISPDGTAFLYTKLVADADDIFFQRVGGRNAVNLTSSPEDEGFGTFSPDGNEIAFSRGDAIWVMGATGESVRRLTDSGYQPSWSPDGKSIVYSSVFAPDPSGRAGIGELWRVDVLSGETKKIDLGGPVDAVQPSCSPDGKWIAYWGLRESTARRMISVVPPEGGTPRVLVDDGFLNWSPAWMPDSRAIVFASDRGGSMNLWLQPFDPATGTANGEPRPVTVSTEWNGPHAIARNGAIAFVARSSTWAVERWPLDVHARRLGEPRTVIGRAGQLALLDPSPDGTLLALGLADPHEDIVVLRLDDPDKQVRLTNDPFRDRGPRWSADGSRIFFYSDRSGEYELWSVRPDGSDLRIEAGEPIILVSPSPDGAYLVGQAGQTGESALVDLARPRDARAPLLLPDIREGVTFGGHTTPAVARKIWSPDGKRIIGAGKPAGTPDGEGVYAYTLETKEYEELLPGKPGSLIAVTPDGGTLVRVREGAVEFVDLRTKAVHVSGRLPRGTFGITITLSRDATALYATVINHESDIWMLDPAK